MFKAQGKFKEMLTGHKSMYFLLMLLLAVPCLVQAGEGDVRWYYDYEYTNSNVSGNATTIKELPDGGFVFCGNLAYDAGGHGCNDFFLIKIDVGGDTVWTKKYHWETTANVAHDMDITSDGGFAISGTRRNFNGQPNDAFFMRTDSNGDSLYTFTISGIGTWDPHQFHSALSVSDGGFLLAGYHYPYSANQNSEFQGLYVKLDSEGAVEWIKRFEADTLGCVFEDAVETPDGDFILTGYKIFASHHEDGPPGYGLDSTHALIVKVNSLGTVEWSNTFGNEIWPFSSILLENGNLICAGIQRDPDDSRPTAPQNFWLAEIETQNGATLLWGKHYPYYELFGLIFGGPVCMTEDGGYLVGGYGNYLDEFWWPAHAPIMLKTDSLGNQEWIRSYVDDATRGFISEIIQTSDGYYVACGATDEILNPDGVLMSIPDPFVMKLEGVYIGIDDNEQVELPSTVSLLENYPNPFNATTSIQFELDRASDITLSVYDVLGRKISALYTGNLSAGTHSITWDGSADSGDDVSSGIYFYRLETVENSISKRMVLLK